MGYLARDTCHVTQEAAAEAACAAYPVAGSAGLTLCTGVQAGGTGIVLQPPAGAASAVQALTFATCEEGVQAADLSGLWLLFVGGAALIWALKNFVAVHVLGNH